MKAKFVLAGHWGVESIEQELDARDGAEMSVSRGLQSEFALYTPIIRTPIADALLDLLATQIVFERLLGKFDDFVIGSETEPDQLVLVEAIDLGVPLLGRQGLQAKSFFETNYSILYLERVGS